MKNENPNPGELSTLLRESRAAPALPPRFQENVWRRIEEGEAPVSAKSTWMEALAAWALRPKFALAMAIVLMGVGSLVGAREGHLEARQQAQTHYLAAVAPNSLR